MAFPAWAGAPASNHIAVQPNDFADVLRRIKNRIDIPKTKDPASRADVSDEQAVFDTMIPLKTKKAVGEGHEHTQYDDYFFVKTSFFLQAPTITKRVWMSQGSDFDDSARMRLILTEPQAAFEHFFYTGLGVPLQVFNSPEDMFIYYQGHDKAGEVVTKEWIYARAPNSPAGSVYKWSISSEDFYRRLVWEPNADGSVNIRRQVVIPNIDAHDYAKQRHYIDMVKQVSKGKWRISGEDLLGVAPPLVFTTREGKRKKARVRVNNLSELEIRINVDEAQYPVLIEAE